MEDYLREGTGTAGASGLSGAAFSTNGKREHNACTQGGHKDIMTRTITGPYAGFSLYILADILAFHSTTAFSGGAGFSEDAASGFAFASIAARVLAFAVVALIAAAAKHDPLPRRLTPAIATVFACAGAALAVAAGARGTDAGIAIAVAGALFGGAQGVMGLVWLTTLPSLSYRTSYLYLLASHAGATVLCVVALLLPTSMLLPVLAASVLAANVCAALLPAAPARPHTVRSQIGGVAPFLWKGVLAVGVFAFLSGFVSSIANHASEPLDPVGMQFFVLAISAAVIIIMLVPALAFHQPLKLENSYKIALPLSALGFLILPGLVSAVPTPVAGVFATTGYMLTGIVLSCTIAEIARAADVPSTSLFAGSDTITLTCLLAGTAIGSAFAAQLSDAGAGVALIGLGSLYLIAIAASSFFGRQRTVRPPEPLIGAMSETDERAEANSSAVARNADTFVVEPPKTRTLDDIAEAHGFTDQERQIFTQLIEGRTIPRIAQDLYLSASTVKYHTQKIYRRYNVHSRSELVAAVGQEQDAERS